MHPARSCMCMVSTVRRGMRVLCQEMPQTDVHVSTILPQQDADQAQSCSIGSIDYIAFKASHT